MMLLCILIRLIPLAIFVLALIGSTFVLVDVLRERRRRLDCNYSGSTYEDVTIGGCPRGAICYSARLQRWAATWNAFPYPGDREHYIYASRDEAIAALDEKFPHKPCAWCSL